MKRTLPIILILAILIAYFIISKSTDDPVTDGKTKSTQAETQNSPNNSSSETTPSSRKITRSTRKIDPEIDNRKAARKTFKIVQTGVQDFYEEYSQLPLGSVANSDQTHVTAGPKGHAFMASLLGLKSARDENYKEISFVAFPKAKDDKNGLKRVPNQAELFDPWGSPYHIKLNYDYDDEIRVPFEFGNEIIYNAKMIIWSPGPDKKSGTDDDICSWK